MYIIEFRNEMNLHGWTNQEHWLQQQAAAFKAVRPDIPVLVYRYGQNTVARIFEFFRHCFHLPLIFF